MFDGKAFGLEIVSAVKAHIVDSLTPILDRLDALEKRGMEKGERGPEGPAGKDADPVTRDQIRDAVLTMPDAISGAVAEYLKANPPADGRDGVDGKDGAPGLDGKDGAPGQNGRDGLDVKDLFRADGGRLMAVMSDGTTKDLGEFVGKNGLDGAPGRDGKDGRDGVGFDDMDLVVADDGAALVFTRGEEKKAFALPVVIDCGVYKQGRGYRKGNGVTWGGSFWIAQKDNPAGKPDAADSDWRLAVKKGQNGKDAEKGGV
jgi:hypothetical protein